MTRDDIMRIAREAWIMDKHDCSDDWFVRADIDERNIFEFAALVAAAEQEKVARWMIRKGYATGHGDTTEDLLAELEWQIEEERAKP